MRRLAFAALALVLLRADMYQDGSNATTKALGNLNIEAGGAIYPAKAYGCAWGPAEDVGPCINAAVDAANAAGGGTVVVPPGAFSLSTTVLPKNRVRVRGAGGAGYGNCGTTLTWSGAGGGVMVRFSSGAATATLSNSGLSDMCLYGGGTAARAVEQWSTTYSDFEHLIIGAVTADAWYAGVAPSLSPNAQNAFNTYRQIGIDLSNAASVSANGWNLAQSTVGDDTNRNIWVGGYVIHQNGRGVICGGADSNQWYGFVTQGAGIGVEMLGRDVASIAYCLGNNWFGASIGAGGVGGPVAQNGTNAGASGNWFYGYKRSDGQPLPIDNTTLKSGVYYLAQGGSWNRVQQPYELNPAAPTPSSNAAWTMMGLAGAYVPRSTGTLEMSLNGSTAHSLVAAAGCYRILYGTGAAPANGVAPPGSAVQAHPQVCLQSPAAATRLPLALKGLVTGLIGGTAYWVDLAVYSFSGAGTLAPQDITLIVREE